MNSFELTKAKPPKHWITPILWGLFIFIVIKIIFSIPIYAMMYIIAGEFTFSMSTQLIVELFTFAIPLIGIIILNRFLNKRSIEALGFHKKDFIKKYGIGILIGLALIFFTCGLSALFGTFTFSFNKYIDWKFIALLMLGFMVQSMTEEVIDRGYIQNGIRIRWGLVATMFIQAFIFMALHSLNPGMTVMPILNLFLFGIFLGLLFYYTDNMWLVGGLHFSWNFLLGPVMGIEVSGLAINGSVLIAKADGPEILTGGSFGMEGSILATVALILGIIIVARIYRNQPKTKPVTENNITEQE